MRTPGARPTAPASAEALRIDHRTIRLTNPDKLLYPRAGFTKRQVVEYYIAVAPYLIPHLTDRPVTLKRYPDGTRGQHFYEKDAPTFTPDWIKTFPVPRRAGGPDINYIIINDAASLAWCATLANLELHPFLHRIPRIDVPTAIVFDLDPGEGMDVLSCGEVALLLRQALASVELQVFPKVSGSKGLQLHVPLNTPVTYEQTGQFALVTAQALERAASSLVVTNMAKARRAGKVFIDWSQNVDYKTTVAVYSLRAKRDQPFVSLPVSWEELERAIAAKDANSLYFDPLAALRRLGEAGDLYRPMLRLKQQLPEFGRASTGRRRATSKPRSLNAYSAKRDFTRTPEPVPAVPRASRQGGRRRFVVQKHAASHLHYDFRLEMHGVLKPWAVPKGIPEKPSERRLAMATEDHPVEYLDFEGTIPQGQYGGGTVMVWDIGTYDIVEGNYWKGELQVSLSGKKLAGIWRLHRDDERKWSLVKLDGDNGRMRGRRPAGDTSALTSRTMERVAADNDRQWQSNRSSDGGRRLSPAGRRHRRPEPVDLATLPAATPTFMEPMWPLLVAALPQGAQWSYEPKLDGYRALALKTANAIQLLSRNRNVLNERFPAIAEALMRIPEGTLIDGEIVALDDAGRPAFDLLQNDGSRAGVHYYAFDALVYRGHSLLALALTDRRKALTAALADIRGPIQASVTLDAPAADLIAAARRVGLEGIVAKRRDSRYEPGRASGAWVKIRVSPGQEFVVGGYLTGARSFDALLVGYYDGPALVFVAKIRNGFTPRAKDGIAARLAGLHTDRCPFANLPERRNARRGLALTADVMKQCRWLKPTLVVQVEFTEWTPRGHLRHASFVALRDDKDPRDVVRESAKPVKRELAPVR
jgi:bifunctional non-homologous end joining protein LigD